jgi:hypothetical protein
MSNVYFPGLGYAHPIDGIPTGFILNVPSGTPVNPLSPTYVMSPLATGSPASGDPLDFGTTQTYQITAQDSTWQDYTVAVAPYTGYAERVMASTPFAYWPLNEGKGLVAYDNSSGHDGDYNATGVSYLVEGPQGPTGDAAVNFSGAAGVAMSVPQAAALCPDGSFSVEMWVKPAAVPPSPSPQYVAANVNMGANREGWYLAEDNGGTFLVGNAFVVRMFNRNGANRACQLYAPIDTVRWYHLVLTYDGATKIARFYEDGVTNETDQYGKATLVSYFGNSSTNPFTVGKRSDGALPWAGSAAQVAFYTHALTPGEIQNHYSATGGGGYADWATTNAPTGTSADDFDGDGVSNGVEWVLGGTAATNDLAKLPKVSTTGGNLVFTFQRALASKTADTAVAIALSTNLETWTPYDVDLPPVEVSPGETEGFETVTLTVPMSPDGKKFARLQVIVTGP